MSDLSNQTPADTYKGLLQVNDYTDGVAGNTGSNALAIQDGAGNATALAVSTDSVGIGTTSPSDSLEVISNGGAFGATITNATANPARLTLTNTEGSAFIDSNNNLLRFGNNTAQDMVIDSDGNVGIGTTIPDYKLDVQESTNGTYAAKIFNNGGDSYGLLVKTSSGINEDFPILDLENTAGNVFRVQADGHVGIGTTSPSGLLHLESAGPALYITDTTNNTDAVISSNNGGDLIFNADLNGVSDGNNPSNIQFKIDGPERMRIDSDGNVGIGTTDPSAKLEVHTESNNINDAYGNLADSLLLKNTSDVVGAGPKLIFYNSQNSGSPSSTPSALIGLQRVNNSNNKGDLVFHTRGTIDPEERMRIDSAGNVGIGTESPEEALHVKTSTPPVLILAERSSNQHSLFSAKNSRASDNQVYFGLTPNGSFGVGHSTDIEADGNFFIKPNGNVGIGTTNPSEKLHVSGNAIITGDLSVSGTTTTINTQTLSVEDHQIILGTLSSGTPTDLTADDGGIVLKGDTDKTILWSNDADAWRCNQNFIADGNVGIGTTSPDRKLDVQGIQGWQDSNGAEKAALNPALNGTDFQLRDSNSDSSIRFDTRLGGNSYINNGNLGVGTTNPDGKLSIVNDGAEGVEIQPGLSAGLNRITNFNRTTNSYNQLAIDASDTFFRSSGTNMIKIESGIISVNPNNEDHDFNVRSDIGEGLFVQGSNGNVGIGTTSPDRLFDVENSDGAAFVSIVGKDDSRAAILFGDVDSDSQGRIDYDNSDDHLHFSTAQTEAMRIDSNGNVGIGTTSPVHKLQIDAGTLYAATRSVVDNLSWDMGVAGSTASNADLRGKFYMWDATNSQTRFVIDSDGNVGIGTTNPDASLTVAQAGTIGGIDLTKACILAGNSTTGIGIDNNEIVKKQGTGGGQLNIVSQGSAASIEFKTGADGANGNVAYDRMIIDSDGNVGIGTTSPDEELHIEGSSAPYIKVEASDNTDAGVALARQGGNKWFILNDADASDNFSIRGDGGGTDEFLTITQDGNVGIGTTDPALTLPAGHATGPMFGLKNGLSASMSLFRYDTSIVNGNVIGGMFFYGNGSTDPISPVTPKELASIECYADEDHSNTSHKSRLSLSTNDGSSLTKRMTIDSDGNVGIGTESPQHILDVRSSEDLTTFVGNQTPGVGIKNENTAVDNVALLAFKASQANTVLAGVGMINRNISTAAAASVGDLAFYSKPSGQSNLNDDPSMTIDSAGNVGIGTTSPGAPLEVSSTTGGVVMPRMTTTQRTDIASPSNGEMVYDTDLNKFYGYANNTWTPLH